MEMIYDCVIQLSIGMDFAHNNGLIHGQFDLSNVIISREGENVIYKLNNFKPSSSLN